MNVDSGERALFSGSAGGSVYTFVCLPGGRYGVRVDGELGEPWDVPDMEGCLAAFLRLVRVGAAVTPDP